MKKEKENIKNKILCLLLCFSVTLVSFSGWVYADEFDDGEESSVEAVVLPASESLQDVFDPGTEEEIFSAGEPAVEIFTDGEDNETPEAEVQMETVSTTEASVNEKPPKLLQINGVQVTGDDGSTDGYIVADTETGWSYDTETGVLTLNNAVITKSSKNYNSGIYWTDGNLTIKLLGENHITIGGYSPHGIMFRTTARRTWSKLTIQGPGSLIMDNGIYNEAEEYDWDEVHIENATLTATGISGRGDVAISDSKVILEGSEYSAFYMTGGVTIRNSYVSAKTDFTPINGNGGLGFALRKDFIVENSQIRIEGSNRDLVFITTPKGKESYSDTVMTIGKETTVYGEAVLKEELKLADGETIDFKENSEIANKELLVLEEGVTVKQNGEEHTHNTDGAVTYTAENETDHIKNIECVGCPVGYCTKIQEAHSGGTATCQKKAVCDLCGADYGEMDKNNHDVSIPYDEEGFCVNGCYQPANLNDGTYEISNAGQLYWFGKEVNAGSRSINGRLTRDIDLRGREWTPICSTDLYHKTTSYPDKGYQGTFDGQGHVLRGFWITGKSGDASYGLFGTLSGTVKRLGISQFSFNYGEAGDVRAAAISGQMLDGSLISDCYVIDSYVVAGNKIGGGIAACCYAGTIQNCFIRNCTVIGYSRCGGLVSDCRGDISKTDRIGTVKNCWADTSVTGTQIAAESILDCHSSVKEEQFGSGEITYKLNHYGDDAGQLWRQNVDNGNSKDAIPQFTGGIVYSTTRGYSNRDDIVSCDITWTSMDFTYSYDNWDPEKLVYKSAGWKTDGGKITMTNNGDLPFRAGWDYTPASEEMKNFTVIVESSWLQINKGESLDANVVLHGQPKQIMEDQTIGTITITIN